VGTCKYCGHPVGFLRSAHPECKDRRQKADAAITSYVTQVIMTGGDLVAAEGHIAAVAKESFVPKQELGQLIVSGWETALDRFLDDGLLDEPEEHRLMNVARHFRLAQEQLDQSGAFSKIVKAATLRDLATGVIPNRITSTTPLPVNLQKGEQVVWLFRDTDYLEDKIRREYVGRSQGVSLRVMKGVYYRVGGFRGRPVEHTERVKVDRGLFVVTNKNIYFAGPAKSLRIPYSKIVSFEPYSNGIGIMRDATNAKAQLFLTQDGWFTYNLVSNLSQL